MFITTTIICAILTLRKLNKICLKLALCNTDEHGNADAERGHDGGRRAPEHVGTAVRTRGKGLQHGEWRERRRVQVRTQS